MNKLVSKKRPVVSVIIPTWNKRELCLNCLEHVFSSTYPKRLLEVTVVDNASEDGTAPTIRSSYPMVKIIDLRKNHGFGGAVNRGIKVATGRYVLILDNDVILSKKAISELVKVAEENKSFGVVSGKLYDGESGKRIQTFFGFIDKTNFQVERIGSGEIDVGQFDQLVLADYISLGAALIRKTVFERVGFLDEKYFIYFEDTDFLFRCKKAGIKVVFIPQVKMWHRSSASLGKRSPRILYYLQRNNMIIRNKFNGLGLLEHFANVKFLVTLFLQMVFIGKKRNEYKAAMMAIIDFYRQEFGEAPEF